MPQPTLATVPFTVDPDRVYTLDEWQMIEEMTGERYEYHEGKLVSVRAMAGGTGMHALIGGNVTGSLFKIVTKTDNGVVGNRCGVYSSDLRLMIQSEGRYVYPDAAVICGRPEYDTKIPTAVRNPLIVVEVTSPKSDDFDSTDKFDYYSTLESLRHYVLVSQARPRVEVRSRATPVEEWTIRVTDALDADAPLSALDAGLPLAEVYRLVEFG